jgi:nucleotidyltransferase/DNA polymerase involved in DNA repair
MHVDMDAFYASVEQRRRPDLAGVPMWVGGERRGVVLSANYAARAWGVRGGMSSAHARRLCPHAVALRPDFDAYTEVSQGILAVLESVSPAVESASIDEAYLDVTTVVGGWGSARAIGEHLRALVADEQRITCSVGIGPNRLLAKMASVAAKPDGLVEVAPGQVGSSCCRCRWSGSSGWGRAPPPGCTPRASSRSPTWWPRRRSTCSAGSAGGRVRCSPNSPADVTTPAWSPVRANEGWATRRPSGPTPPMLP